MVLNFWCSAVSAIALLTCSSLAWGDNCISPGPDSNVGLDTGEATCDIRFGENKARFAGCDGPDIVRHFDTVVLALHGWSGSCKTTFGDYEKSMFSLMSGEAYFDWDCMDYDSHNATPEEICQALDGRISRLGSRGYKQVILVTHSTGGVVALDYLTRRRAEIAERLEPRMTHIHAWAAPIEGLKPQISLASVLLNFFGLSDGALPHLRDRNSTYLTELRARVRQYIDDIGALRPEHRRSVTKTVFYHGQGTDWVVNAFPDTIPDYIADDYTRLVYSRLPHTDNVGDSGTPEAHAFPAELMSSKFVHEVNVAPNLELFTEVPDSAAGVPAALEKHQKIVIDGLGKVLRHNITAAMRSLRKFLTYFYGLDDQHSHYRSVDVDIDFAEKLYAEAIEASHNRPPADVARFWVDVFHYAIARYAPPQRQLLQGVQQASLAPNPGITRRHPAHGNANFVRLTARMIRATSEIVNRISDNCASPCDELEDVLRSYDGDLARFRAEIASVTAQYAQSADSETVALAFDHFASFSNNWSPEEISGSGLVDRLTESYEANVWRLGKDIQKGIMSAYTSLSSKSPQLQGLVVQTLMKENAYGAAGGRMVPLWKTIRLEHDQGFADLIATFPDDPVGQDFVAKGGSSKFVFEYAWQGGSLGNDRVATNSGFEKFEQMNPIPEDKIKQFKALAGELGKPAFPGLLPTFVPNNKKGFVQ